MLVAYLFTLQVNSANKELDLVMLTHSLNDTHVQQSQHRSLSGALDFVRLVWPHCPLFACHSRLTPHQRFGALKISMEAVGRVSKHFAEMLLLNSCEKPIEHLGPFCSHTWRKYRLLNDKLKLDVKIVVESHFVHHSLLVSSSGLIIIPYKCRHVLSLLIVLGEITV